MKILMLSHTSDLAGGAERSMLDVLDYWSKQYDIKPEFILRQPARSLAAALKARGWKYHLLNYTFWSDAVPPTRSYDIFQAATVNAKAVADIERLIKKIKPDAVMTNSVVAPWAALAAYFQQVPHIWFVREYGDLDHGRIFELGREATFQDVGTLSSLVVANSQTLADHIKQYVPADKVTAVYTPFPLDVIKKKLAEKTLSPYESANSLKLVLTGTLAPSKGHHEVVAAVGILNAQGHDVEVSIIGGSPSDGYFARLRKIIEKYGIENKVHFVGHRSNPLSVVALADVGIMASRKEAFGRVTYEYMIAGKPVVGAASGATPELIDEGKTGYLYKQGSSRDLAKQLLHYANDRGLLKQHGTAAKKKAEAMQKGDYSADAIYKRIRRLVEASPVLPQPVHFAHRWMEYMLSADTALEDFRSLSVYRVAKWKLRLKAKELYHRARTAKTDLTGK